MKISILTFSKEHNYGATLQCYALYSFLMNWGHDVNVVDIQLASVKMRFISKVLRFMDYLLFPIFRKKHIRFTSRYKKVSDLYQNPPQSDIYVVGSDQVWNPNITKRLDPLIYFLPFVPQNGKKISYAASFGMEEWTDLVLAEKIKPLISSFNHVSVREEEGVKICKSTFGIDSTMVLDPTFLIDSYDSICGKYDSSKKTNELVFFTFKRDDELAEIVLNISRNLCVKPVLLGGVRGITGYKMRRIVSVPRWLRSIRYAKYVITDSFHCTVFCILFHKQFLVTPAVEGRNGRLVSLLKLLDLSDRFCNLDDLKHRGSALLKTTIDFDSVEKKLNRLRTQSIDFLRNAIK